MTSFSSLSDHLRDVREKLKIRGGRSYAMSVSDVQACAIQSKLTEVSEIFFIRAEGFAKASGMLSQFVRITLESGDHRALIILDSAVSKDKAEFLIIKELMFCWAGKETYTPSESEALKLRKALLFLASKEKTMANCDDVTVADIKRAMADKAADSAAREIILPANLALQDLAKDDANTLSMRMAIEKCASERGLNSYIAERVYDMTSFPIRQSGSL